LRKPSAREPCGKRERFNVSKLMEQHGDAKLTDERT
jgi:hypothetical protein